MVRMRKRIPQAANNNNKEIHYSRRSVGALFVILLIFISFVWELFSKSILNNQYYLALAHNQQVMTTELAPKRGVIYASDDIEADKKAVVADSVERFALSVTPKNVPSSKRRKLAAIFKPYINDLSQDQIIKILAKDKMYTPPLKHGLDKKQVKEIANKINPKIEINFDKGSGDIIYLSDGIMFLREFSRLYPENALSSHILGFVDKEGRGRYGIEEYYDLELKGISGSVAVEKDSSGEILNKIGTIQRKNGIDLVLTIDRNIQYFVENKLAEAVEKYAAESGIVIIIDPKTGAIISMASSPSYNPNEYTKTEYSKFLNPATNQYYEAGSVMKSFTVAASLDLGLVTPDTKNDFPNSLTIGSYTISNVGDKSYPNSTVTGILDNSINTGAAWLAQKLGKENFYNYLKNFGFGQKTNIEIPGEIAGKLADFKKWKDIDLATISFGQGQAVTPIQLAAGYSAIVNGGKLMQPYLIKEKIIDGNKVIKTEPKEIRQVINSETSDKLKVMLEHVVEYGHAQHAAVPGYKVGGKTGTAQIPVRGVYSEEETNQTFVGTSPIDEPKFVITVILHKPKNSIWADSSTVYVFSDIAKFILNYWQVPPNK